jgi:hypothetical protein
MSMLNDLGVKYGTDQSTLRHCYLSLFELLFARFNRNLYVILLEIGFQFGCSSRTWKEYFPYGHITGIDLVDNHAEGLDKTIYGDAYSSAVFEQLPKNHFHIIIEDGSHAEQDQSYAVTNYSHLLTPDGILIIEDIASLGVTDQLSKVVPSGFNHAVIDLRTVNPGVIDNILFLVWRK